MLLNISKYPFDEWPEEQKKAAKKQFGEVVDWPVPDVPVNATAQEVERLADKYFFDICELDPEPNAIYVMGDRTFSFSLIYWLLDYQFKVVDVIIHEGKFVQFRDFVK